MSICIYLPSLLQCQEWYMQMHTNNYVILAQTIAWTNNCRHERNTYINGFNIKRSEQKANIHVNLRFICCLDSPLLLYFVGLVYIIPVFHFNRKIVTRFDCITTYSFVIFSSKNRIPDYQHLCMTQHNSWNVNKKYVTERDRICVMSSFQNLLK